MRDLVAWGTALAFLLTALYAVTVRREVITVARSTGALSRQVAELSRRNHNLSLEVARLRSPGALTNRAITFGVAPLHLVDEQQKAKR